MTENIGIKTAGMCVFVVLLFIGVIFLLASPVDDTRAGSRVITGLLLVIIAFVALIVPYKLKGRKSAPVLRDAIDELVAGRYHAPERKKYTPKEVVCPNCKYAIPLTHGLKEEKAVTCEKCGEEITIPKDEINW